MALSREMYRELEAIVGTSFISEDPTVLESYRYSLMGTSIHIGPWYQAFTPRPGAVLLPATTEEVQAIVKVCNKYKTKLKASSTFWSAMGYVSSNDAVQVDMKRMDRILEIDEKNMFAVVEPRVICATLQAEAMKLGLNTHITGAGASCSPLASATSYSGRGPDTIFMSYADDNLLGVEWITLDGEIHRIGSVNSGAGWFCGEGIGPSMKGLLRGGVGPKGGMGIFTKCAVKLFPWPGPAKLNIEGIVPAYKVVLPNNFKAYTLAFPTWEAYGDCSHRIYDAGIGYIGHRQFGLFGRDLKGAVLKIVTDPTKTLDDLEELLENPEAQKLKEELHNEFQLILVGMTARDIEWQDKALDQILAEVGGWKVAEMSEPEMEKWVLLYLLRLGKKNYNQIYGGAWDSCSGGGGSSAIVEKMHEFRRSWENTGVLAAAGGDCGLGGISSGGFGFDNFAFWDPHDKKSVEGTFAYFEENAKLVNELKLGEPIERRNVLCRGSDGKEIPQGVRDKALATTGQAIAYHYQYKIKQVLDPNNLGDTYYTWLEKWGK